MSLSHLGHFDSTGSVSGSYKNFEKLFDDREYLEIDKKKFEKAECDRYLNALGTIALRQLDKGNLPLFDAMTHNNQCHLLSLKVISLYKKRKETQSLKNKEVRFLTQCFLITSVFNRNKKLLVDLFPKEFEKEKKRLNLLINAQVTVDLARQKVIESMHRFIVKGIRQMPCAPSDFGELEMVALENDRAFEPSRKRQYLTFNKYSGVRLFCELLKRESIPLVFKVKVLCQEGFHTKVYFTPNIESKLFPLSEEVALQLQEVPTVVVEGFSSESPSTCAYFNDRNTCANSLLNASSKAHPTCKVCIPCPNEDACQRAIEYAEMMAAQKGTSEKIMMAQGADFTKVLQKELYQKYFSSESDFCPELKEAFAKRIRFGEKNGFSMQNSTSFVIEHVYADIGLHVSKPRFLDTKPQEFIESRGVDEKL